jgi:hypothetical protein
MTQTRKRGKEGGEKGLDKNSLKKSTNLRNRRLKMWRGFMGGSQILQKLTKR